MTDQFSVRTVIAGLVLVLVLCTIGIIGLSYFEKPIPDQLDRLAVLVGGATAGILAKTSSKEDDGVTINNDTNNPVPTTPA